MSITPFAASRATSASTTSPAGRTAAPRITASPLTAGSFVKTAVTSSVSSVGTNTCMRSMRPVSCRLEGSPWRRARKDDVKNCAAG